MLVDDHGIIRDGLRLVLESEADMKVVGEAENGAEALEIAPRVQPDVVILDISMPGMDGFDCARGLTKLLPDTKILALTVHDDVQYVLRILHAGAHGFLSKRAVSSQLITAVNTILSGETYISSEISAKLASRLMRASPEREALASLSAREFQALQHLGEGHTLKETAAALGVSEKTVSTYRSRLLQKLGLQSGAELMRFALQINLLE
jgi:two-component system response regulator NreC